MNIAELFARALTGGARSDGSGRWRRATHEVNGQTRPILKPRDRSKYSPRRNTPKAARR